MRSLYILAAFISVATLSAIAGGNDSSSAVTHLIVRTSPSDSVPVRTIPLLPRLQHQPKIGLVLTGGGARGIAQIGVLKVFEQNHIPIDFIAATSIGSVVGGLYAAGWTATEIESIAHATNWDEVLSLSDETKRSELFVDQKLAVDRSFLVLRFQGLQPVLPSAVSSGQRLTGLLNLVTLQAPYHPYHSFDDMKISFRAVATDLVSGKRVVMGEGSLAEALRASATVPILFNPIERDSMQLVDGGLVSNVPVDVAKAQGCDLIIVLNTTSGLRTSDQMKAPWETADQIMGIMMQHANQEQLKAADIVITPDIGDHLSSDFHRLDTLIQRGEEAGQKAVSKVLNQIAERKFRLAAVDGPEARRVFPNVRILRSGDSIPDSIWNHISGEGRLGVVSLYEIRDHVNILSELGIFRNVEAVIDIGRDSTTVDYRVMTNPRLTGVTFEGCRLVPASELEPEFRGLLGRPMDLKALTAAVEGAVRVYRTRGYSLARIDSFQFDAGSGLLHIVVNEGEIRRITVEGGVRTQDWFVLRDFPLQEGDVFEIDKANQGITNINSTALFEYVYLEVTYPPDGPVLTIRLKERPSQLMRFGVRVDNERKLQGSLDMRDENFRGTGMQLGLNVTGGPRNVDAALEFNARRLFDTYFTFGVSAFFRRLDSYYYENAPSPGANQWEREIAGEYRDQRLGGSFAFGSQLERLGNLKVEFLAASVRVTNLRDVEYLEDHYQLRMIRVGTVIDTKNSYPFPIGGVGFNLSYEFALDILGGSVSYNALRVLYESFTPIVSRFTFHPKFTLGFADKSMPFSQEFRLGGQDNFFGLREDDRRGRQLLKANFEFRYKLPFRLLWDAYLRVRYDLATISDIPEAIKFTNLLHGVGGELAIDTPIGPALFAAGKSFYFSKDLPENPVQQGPWILYFMIGYQI